MSNDKAIEKGNREILNEIDIFLVLEEDLAGLGFKGGFLKSKPVRILATIGSNRLSLEEASKYIKDNFDIEIPTISYNINCTSSTTKEEDLDELLEDLKSRLMVFSENSRIDNLRKKINKEYHEYYTKGEMMIISDSSIELSMVIINVNSSRSASGRYYQKRNESSTIETEVLFKNKRNPRYTFKVFKTRDGRITRIENNLNIRFPFYVGQIFNRTIEVWACNNGYLMNDKDTCPEEKVMGIRVSDIPQGHQLRHLYPHKFKK